MRAVINIQYLLMAADVALMLLDSDQVRSRDRTPHQAPLGVMHEVDPTYLDRVQEVVLLPSVPLVELVPAKGTLQERLLLDKPIQAVLMVPVAEYFTGFLDGFLVP